jgi:hypothetical protein
MGIPDYDAPNNGRTASQGPKIERPQIPLHKKMSVAITHSVEVVYALEDLINRIHSPDKAPPGRATKALNLSLVEVLNKGPKMIEANTEAALRTIDFVEKALFEEDPEKAYEPES